MAKLGIFKNFFKRKNEPVNTEEEILVQVPEAEPAEEKKPEVIKPVSEAAKKTEPVKEKEAVQPEPSSKPEKLVPQTVRLSAKTRHIASQTCAFLKSIGQDQAALSVEQAVQTAEKDIFSVAVVGEFSRGKSTFLNGLLEGNHLPVGVLPTTAVLTRIRYNEKNVLVHVDANGARKKAVPLTLGAWDDLVADNFGEDEPEGAAMVGVDNPWLKEAGVEMIDTPGAGDLNEKRAWVIGNALLGADGAIITIDANAPMSMSEKLFVEQRLITRKTPHLMLVLTKLDQIRFEERSMTVNYVKNVLDRWQEEWKVSIPMYIPYEVDMPTEEFSDIIGIDRVRDKITEWSCSPERAKITEKWLISRISGIIDIAVQSIEDKQKLLKLEDDKRRQLLNEKKQALRKAAVVWEKLRTEMMKKCTECCQAVSEKADKYEKSIVEDIVFNAKNAPKPQKWWEETYPYLLKTKLATMSAGLEALAVSKINADTRAFSAFLDKQFHRSITVEAGSVSSEEDFNIANQRKSVDLADLDTLRNRTRIRNTVLTLAGVLVCSSMGALPMIATMGIGTGTSILSEKTFNKRREEQQDEIIRVVRSNVPEIIAKAMTNAENRIAKMYEDVIAEAYQQEKIWMQAQLKAIEESDKPIDNTREAELKMQMDTANKLIRQIELLDE